MTTGLTLRRLVVPSVAPPASRSVVHALAERRGLAVVERPVAGDQIVGEPGIGDVLVHSVPDVFGRDLAPPRVWKVLRVVDAALGLEPDRREVRYGVASEGRLLSERLAALWKPLSQQRGVRPLLTHPAPFGLAFVAPAGIEVPDDFTATPVPWPGVPDLVVVHHPELSAWAAYDGEIESPEWI